MVERDAETLLQEQQQNIVQHSLRELLDSNLPHKIAQLEESTVNLERVAAYCEANYIQSQYKPALLAETKRYALQSLASVAYLVGELSRSLVYALDLEQLNLAQKTNEIQNTSQLVAIQREKAARREIGKLTTAKNIVRQNKITYPTTEEHIPRYQRTAIDFSVLDGIGHGRRTSTQTNEYGSISIGYTAGVGYATSVPGDMPTMMQRQTGSTTSGDSAGGNGSIGSGSLQQQQPQPIYDHYSYSRTGYYGTLTRGSIRSTMGQVAAMHDQYRVPQAIPSAIQHQIRNHYSSIQPSMGFDQQQQQEQQQLRYATTMGLNGNGGYNIAGVIDNRQFNNNNHYDYEQYGTLRATPAAHVSCTIADTAVVNHMPPEQELLHPGDANHEHLNPTSTRRDDESDMHNSADYSDDGLPLPPPLFLTGALQQPQPGQLNRHSNNTDCDDGLPLPPPPYSQILITDTTKTSMENGGNIGTSQNEQQQQHNNNMLPNWVPQQYIEKALVLYDYESRNPDELRLYQGAVVYVLRKNEDGWFEGVMDGITGLFPGNYVQQLAN